MFHPALWKLIRLQLKGGFRQFFRSLRTYRGMFQALFLLAMIGQFSVSMFIASTVNSTSSPINPVFGNLQLLIHNFMSIGLLVATVYVVVFSTGEATVYFSASEVAFLFSAPITRTQLLSYKLLKSLLGIASLSLVCTLLSGPPLSMILCRWLAITLTVSYLQLLTMNVAFVRQVLHQKLHRVVRTVVGIVFGILVLFSINQTSQSLSHLDFQELLKTFQTSTAGQLLLAPFGVFVSAIRATTWVAFLQSGSILMALDGFLLWLAYHLDALSLEAAFALSEKMTVRLKLLQTKGVWQFLAPAKSNVARRRFPQPPFWGGIGPFLWQRMNTTIRCSPKLLWVPVGVVGVAAVIVYHMERSHPNSPVAALMGIGIVSYCSFIVSLTLQHEIERVGFLKSLPIPSYAIVIGDLIGLPLAIAAIQSLFLVAEACYFRSYAPWLLAGACLTPLLNFVLFGIDQLVFYIYPTRLAKGTPGDFGASGKQMIYIMFKVLMLGGAAIIVLLAVLPGLLLFNSPQVAMGSAAIALLAECVVLVPMMTSAFNRFDPGVTIVT